MTTPTDIQLWKWETTQDLKPIRAITNNKGEVREGRLIFPRKEPHN